MIPILYFIRFSLQPFQLGRRGTRDFFTAHSQLACSQLAAHCGCRKFRYPMGDATPAEVEGGGTATEGGTDGPASGWAEVSAALWPAPNRDGATASLSLANSPRGFTDGDDGDGDDLQALLDFGDKEDGESEAPEEEEEEGSGSAAEGGRTPVGDPPAGGNGDAEEKYDEQTRQVLSLKICVACLCSALKPTPICGGFCKVRLYWR